MADSTDTHDFSNGLLDLFCLHLIALAWLDAKREPDGPDEDPQGFCVSAFVISVRDIWFLVTAGHILHDLDTRLEGGRRIVSSRLIDGLASQGRFPPIPFTLDETRHGYIDCDGLDYGLIPLRPIFVQQLRAGGVLALSEDSWAEVPDSPDAYFLVGFPRDARRVTATPDGEVGHVNIEFGTPLLRLRRIDDPPPALRLGADRFYAEVPIITGTVDGRTITLNDIDGMSGGPIFAIKQTDERTCRYWVVAVQSAWLRSSRVLAGCFIKRLADAIARFLDAQDAGPDEPHSGDSLP